jgi:PGF-pre-PGF domain-containing protein
MPSNGTGPANATTPSFNEPDTKRIYEEISPDKPARLIPDAPSSTVSQISVTARNRVFNAGITFSESDSPPREIPPEPPEREVFRYLNITKENIGDDDIDSATIDFEVTKAWLRERRINVSTVRLRRSAGGQWQDLPTTLLFYDSDKFYFQASTPGFSIFAIAGEYMLEKSGGGMMCLPLDIRCSGSQVQECDIDGLSWTIIEECEHGCSSPGVCNPEAAEQSPVSGEDYVLILMIALLAVIAILGFAVMFFRIKRKKISQELDRPVTTPGIK